MKAGAKGCGSESVEMTAMTDDMRGKGTKLGERVDEERENKKARKIQPTQFSP